MKEKRKSPSREESFVKKSRVFKRQSVPNCRGSSGELSQRTNKRLGEKSGEFGA